jgi:formylglycine-generating enzyme required for sulfatase activity
LDRDRALLRSTSAPASQTTTQKAQVEELPEVEKVFCKRCGAGAKPFSRFCETCGNTLEAPKDAPITGKLKTPPAAASLRTQIDASHSTLQAGAQAGASLGAHAEEPIRNARTTQSDPPPPPPPRIVRRLSPEGGQRKTIPISESSQTGALSEKTERLAAGIDSTRPTNPAGPTRRTGRTGAVVSSVASSASAATSSIRNASRRLSRRLTAQPVYQLPPPQEERRSSWPMIAMAMMVLLAVTVVIWWLRMHPTGRLFSSSDQPAVRVDEDAASDPPASVNAGASPAPSLASPSPSVPAVTAPEGMVYVPGGTFEMGRSGGDDAETPPHKVTVKPFFIDRTEVTNEAYLRFVAATARAVPSHWTDGKISAGAERHPVVNLTWEDANAYAQWAGKRLPSEAEWELAARGTDGRLYPWGNEWNRAFANAGNAENGRIVEAGGYLSGASPYGALDMCGNVWEWTSSKLLSYQNRNEIAPGRVVRGGAFNANNTTSTTTYRGVLQPDKAYPRTGFRCVRDVK